MPWWSSLFAAPLLLLALGCAGSQVAFAQTVILGQTNILGYGDGGNANLVLAQGPYNLAKAATLTSLSFYVTTAAGKLTLGIYSSGPNNNCAGGTLVAQSNPFTPKGNSWNTVPPKSAVTLSPGNYCLAYMPSNNNLTFKKGMVSGIIDPYFAHSFGTGVLPSTFSANPSQSTGDGFSWSLYATLMTVNSGQTPVSVQFNPANVSVPDSSLAGTALSSVLVQTSDGQTFSGTVSILSQSASNMVALSAGVLPANVQVSSISSADDGSQSVTVQACENGVCSQGTLPITVTPSSTPTLSLTVVPPSPSVAESISVGTVIATLRATWSNGGAFTGTFQFVAPNNDDGGLFAISGSNLVVNADLSSYSGSTQHVTVEAVQ